MGSQGKQSNYGRNRSVAGREMARGADCLFHFRGIIYYLNVFMYADGAAHGSCPERREVEIKK